MMVGYVILILNESISTINNDKYSFFSNKVLAVVFTGYELSCLPNVICVYAKNLQMKFSE